jgi:hypothetical protein
MPAFMPSALAVMPAYLRDHYYEESLLSHSTPTQNSEKLEGGGYETVYSRSQNFI